MTIADAEERSAAPLFALRDCRGQIVRLADLLARGPEAAGPGDSRDSRDSRASRASRASGGPVVIVFYRGHWCPYCRRYLGKLQANYPRLLGRGASLVAITPEPPATAARLAEELHLTFPLLCDTAGEVIDQYGTRNRLTAARTVMPHPSVFIVGRDGAIRFRSIDRNYKRRTTMHTIFSVLNDLADG